MDANRLDTLLAVANRFQHDASIAAIEELGNGNVNDNGNIIVNVNDLTMSLTSSSIHSLSESTPWPE